MHRATLFCSLRSTVSRMSCFTVGSGSDAHRRSRAHRSLQKRNECLDQGEDRVDALVPRPEHDDTGIVGGRIGPDVPKAAVKCDERPRLAAAHFGDLWVGGTSKLLLKHSRVISWPAVRRSIAAESGRFSSILGLTAMPMCWLGRRPQAGNPRLCSRANSAAYESAAVIASGVSEGYSASNRSSGTRAARLSTTTDTGIRAGDAGHSVHHVWVH